jgi:hypothetical protein
MKKWKSKATKSPHPQSLGLRNSKYLHQSSRPNNLDELSYQDEVTNSLRNVLKTGNVRLHHYKAPTFAVLRTGRYRKDIGHYRHE